MNQPTRDNLLKALWAKRVKLSIERVHANDVTPKHVRERRRQLLLGEMKALDDEMRALGARV